MAAGNRIAYVDSLRFIAAFFVVLQHYLERQTDAFSQAFVNLGPGVGGVALFFLVSGFIIPFSVAKGFNPVDYAIRRVTRIYPLYLFLLGVLALHQFVGIGLGEQPEYGAYDWTVAIPILSEYVGGTPIIGVAWTLPLEFAWYVLFALFVTVFDARIARRLEMAMIAIILFAVAVSIAFEIHVPAGRLFMLYAAVIGYKTYLLTSGQLRTPEFIKSVVIFVALLIPVYYVSFSVFPHDTLTFEQALMPWLLATTIFLVVALVPQIRNSRVLCNPVIAYLGAISYSVYLTHITVYEALQPHVGKQYLLVVAVAVTLLVSSITFFLIEKNGIKLGRVLSGLLKDHAKTKNFTHT